MPVCEKCQTAYDEWQHFCMNCGHYLKVDPLPVLRCPRCGAQAAIEHNFCPECAAPLKEDMAQAAPHASRKWLVGGVVAALLGLGVILVLHLPRQPPPPEQMVEPSVPPLKMAEKPAVSGETDAKAPGTAVSLQAELEEVLNKIKEANLNKNILLFMDTLSVLYPQLEKKRQEVLKTWENFDFKGMAYTIKKIQESNSGNAVAEVNWRTSTQNLTTKDLRTDDFQYRVWFAKELGQWKIKKIEELQP
jgi:hypothetical protein